jgi:hypothetical protein
MQNPQPKKSGRKTSSLRDELLGCCKASSEMMRWQKKHSTNGMNYLRLPLQCPLISVFLFFFQFCRLQTLAGHFFHFFGAKFSRIYVRKTTISRFFSNLFGCEISPQKKKKSLPVVMPMFVCFEVKAPTCVTYQPSATPLG